MFLYKLRTLLIMFAVIAAALGPLAEHYRARSHALEVLNRSGCRVYFSNRDIVPPRLPLWIPAALSASVQSIHFHDKELSGETLEAVLRLSEVSEVSIVDADVSPATTAVLARLPRLKQICLLRCRLQEGAVAALQACKTLDELNLGYSNVSSADCRALAEIRSLRTVWLYASTATDEGVLALANLPSLLRIDVSADGITQQGIEQLLAGTRLEHLTSYGDNFSDEWWTKAKAKYPNCRFHR